jgi:autotransporter-associated beta strand protein
VDDNPDNLPDLSDGMIKRLWQEGQSGEFWPATLDRLTPTTSLKDISGYYARRCATWDFSNQTAMNTDLNSQDPTRNARHLFTDLIQRPDAPGWWRVPPNKAPAQGAYAMHELIPTGSGAGRVVTVNLQGLADSARGADWRASFIAISDTGVERYTPLWNNGSSSIILAANENKLYLSVAGTPDWYANGGFNEPSEPFRSHPSRSRFHYQLQVTGATPRERNNGSTTSGYVVHSNGGGLKARTASVAAAAYLGPNARVEDYAVVSGGTVTSDAVISGHAWVRGGTVTGNARVRDWAIVDSGTISGNARVLEHATVQGNLQDTAVAKGSALHQGGTLSGNAIIDGDYMGNKSISGGITFGHLPFVGIPDNFTTSTPAGHYASYDFSSAHDSRALDRYGVTDAFTIGSPPWTFTDWKRKAFLSFNGSNQYLALDRSVADSRAFTFSAWVKPTGGPANQAVLWLGSSPTKRLALTANDGNGLTRFSIVNGGAEQFLTSAALPTGVWSHVAVALDGSTGTLFVNGTSVATGAITLTPDQLLAPNTTTGTQHNYLARSEGTAMPMFQGSIDDAQFYSSALDATQLAAVTVPLGGDVLVSDNFNSASNSSGAFNSTLSADQQGLLTPLAYTVSAPGGDWSTQHGNGGAMLIANAGNNNWVSPNFDFSTVANSLNRPLVIEFDAWVTATTNPDAWLGFGIDTAQGTYVEDQKYSSLARLSAGTHTYKFVFSDTAGAGSAFNGVTNGAKVQRFIDNIAQGTTTTTLGPGDGYITFQQDRWSGYSIGLVDNFSVSVVSATTFAVNYNGNTNTGGSVPIDTSSPYAQNSTVTVLGNAGSLVKTGYSFANWNTAANGSGTAYNPGDTFPITAPVTLHAQWSPGPDFIWTNSAGTNLWTTTDTNWLGAPWVNSISNKAWFQATGGGITLASGLTAGAVNVGNSSANFPATSFSGGSLAATSLTVQGFGSNNGDYTANPTLTLNSAITLTGDAAIGRANLVVTGGTLTANRIISNSASADWGRLAIQGGTVTATNGVDGSANTGVTFQVELNGGILETPSLRVANRDLNAAGPDSINDAHLIFNGGTLKAIGPDNANFITLYGDGGNLANPTQATYVKSGGAIIDTNGRNIGIPVKLLGGGSGGLTKNGIGTLALTAFNTYAGPTTVSAGTLRLGNGASNTNLANTADVILDAGAALHLDYSGTDTIDELTVSGIAKSPGVYSAANSPFITGPGTLTVTNGPPNDYNTWKSAQGVSGGENDDDDHDGLANFGEYAFGLDPSNGTSVRPVTGAITPVNGTFTYTRRKTALTGLTYSVRTSTDLTSWNQDATASQTATAIPATDNESVEVTLSPGLLNADRLFVRIHAH